MNIFTTNIVIIKISAFLGFFFFCTSMLLFIAVVLKRIYLTKKEKRENRLLEEWRPILLENLYALPASFTHITKKHTILFLIFWNNLQDILKGPEKEQLNQLARVLHMDQIADKMLSSRRFSERLLAIAVLGNLGAEQSWYKIYGFSESSNMTLAINAIHALAKINPEKAVSVVLAFMVHREDWPNYKIAAILNEIGASRFSKPLADEIRLLSTDKQSRLLSMMDFADGKVVITLVKQLLLATMHSEVISSCLRLIAIFGDHRDVPVVKKYLKHPQSFIRMSAVKSLALIGKEDELPSLEKCLCDRDWWVRYRAAQAIKLIPTTSNERILEIRARQSDGFAIDILNYIIS